MPKTEGFVIWNVKSDKMDIGSPKQMTCQIQALDTEMHHSACPWQKLKLFRGTFWALECFQKLFERLNGFKNFFGRWNFFKHFHGKFIRWSFPAFPKLDIFLYVCACRTRILIQYGSKHNKDNDCDFYDHYQTWMPLVL